MLSFIISPQSNFDIFLMTIGGLCVFLFGLNLTKENLKSIATEKLKQIIFNSTNTILKSFLVGFIATVIIQSSSGVTAIVVSFIAAGYLTFPQGLGIMIGANLGTCTTAFLIGFNIQEWAFIVIIVASIASFILKDQRKQKIAQTILGIGVLFLGLQFMESGFNAIARSNVFADVIIKYSNNNIIALILGITLTFIIQSSSAIIGILEQIYAAEIIKLIPAIVLMLGSNIGTTMTGLIATYKTSYQAKKAVIANIIFNVFGMLLFVIILKPFAYLLKLLEQQSFQTRPELTIAFAHLFFNLITVILGYFFFKQLIYITEKITTKENITFYKNKKTIPIG